MSVRFIEYLSFTNKTDLTFPCKKKLKICINLWLEDHKNSPAKINLQHGCCGSESNVHLISPKTSRLVVIIIRQMSVTIKS